MKIIIIVFLMFVSIPLFSQTAQMLLPASTMYNKILIEIDKIEDKENKIEEIDKELAKGLDDMAGQMLLDYKTILEVETKNKENGRNYVGYIYYRSYIKKDFLGK